MPLPVAAAKKASDAWGNTTGTVPMTTLSTFGSAIAGADKDCSFARRRASSDHPQGCRGNTVVPSPCRFAERYPVLTSVLPLPGD
eukprot:653563-Rhodomonas_salina.3